MSNYRGSDNPVADALLDRLHAAEAWRREVEAGIPGDLPADVPQKCTAGAIVWGFSVLRGEVRRLLDENARLVALLEAKGGGASAQQHTDVDGGAGADAPATFSSKG